MFTNEQIRSVYLARKERAQHPSGTFDKAGRFWPDACEDVGLAGIRTPTRRWPYSYMLACRTLKHCRLLAEHNPDYFKTLIPQ